MNDQIIEIFKQSKELADKADQFVSLAWKCKLNFVTWPMQRFYIKKATECMEESKLKLRLALLLDEVLRDKKDEKRT